MSIELGCYVPASESRHEESNMPFSFDPETFVSSDPDSGRSLRVGARDRDGISEYTIYGPDIPIAISLLVAQNYPSTAKGEGQPPDGVENTYVFKCYLNNTFTPSFSNESLENIIREAITPYRKWLWKTEDPGLFEVKIVAYDEMLRWK